MFDNGIHTTLSDLVAGLDPVLQFLAIMAIGLVPFLESYVGALVGTVTGVPVVLATGAAVLRNLVAVVVAVVAGGAARRRWRANRTERPVSARRQKVVERVDRFGVPVASLLAPLVLAISLTAFIMVTAGLDRRQVLVWQSVAVVAWGALFALIGTGALAALG